MGTENWLKLNNLDTAARRFSVAAPRLWNSLPLNCRTAPSVNTFKIRLKTLTALQHAPLYYGAI